MDPDTKQGAAIDDAATLAAFRLVLCLEIDAIHSRIDKLNGEAQP